ncbi:hypothetical protein AAHH79_36880, partial [Burkholderia pseudomallei]
TPAGAAAPPPDESHNPQASDHAASAQGNRAGGHSPAWHGAGGGAKRHDHAGARSGFKSPGFDGQGSNQLVADDTDRRGRMQ